MKRLDRLWLSFTKNGRAYLRRGANPFEGFPHDRFRGLAEYNAEIGRGLVHPPEYDVKMRTLQRQYDDLTRAWPVDDVSAWFAAWRLQH